MSEALFMKIISELRDIHFSGRLSLFQNGEPLLDKRLSKWISLSKQYCPDAFTFIITNGDLLTHEGTVDLFLSGLDALKVNTYDKQTFYRVKETVEKLEENLIKKILFLDYSEKNDWTNRGGTVPSSISPTISPDNICVRPFRQLYISCKGTVPQCCADYLQKNIMGDINNQSLMDIWYGEPFSELRYSLLGKAPLNDICKVCNIGTSYETVEDLRKIFSSIS
jgi:MoaA/NifB/PqqE/SkfB family radical SAM enzyme